LAHDRYWNQVIPVQTELSLQKKRLNPKVLINHSFPVEKNVYEFKKLRLHEKELVYIKLRLVLKAALVVYTTAHSFTVMSVKWAIK